MILIGISGKKRSGKNTVAKYIATLTNQSVEEFAFAKELKLELASMLKISYAEIESNKELYRHLLQALGEYRRQTKNELYWVEKVCRKILKSQADIAIITDVRHISEAESIRQMGGCLLRVEKDSGIVDNHISEVALDNYKNFDRKINNNFTLEYLLFEVKNICKELKIKLK